MAKHSALYDSEMERIARERLEAEREARRMYRREMFRVAAECLGSTVLGLVCMGFGLHTTDRATGQIFWWGGMTLGYAGIAISLGAAYLRGEKRGDW